MVKEFDINLEIKNISIAGNIKKTSKKIIELIINTLLSCDNFNLNTVFPLKYNTLPSLKIDEVSPSNTDILFVLGGDGTIIGIVRNLKQQVPILGINVGSKGVLTEIFPDEINLAIEAIKENRYLIQERMMLKLSIKQKSIEENALNEIFVYRGSLTHLPTFSIIQSDFYIRKKMDGIIVSTPTGSTGHSFSLGGPIIDETLEVFLINLIGSIQRLPQFILQPIPITIACSNKFYVVVDGQVKYLLNKDAEVEIMKSEKKAKIVRLFGGRLSHIEKLGFERTGAL
ncbi:MAG: NAD(+)/NADH kinase [Nitrososphaeria archaeon]